MKPLSQLVRPNIRALQPYSTARDEYAGGGIDVWLDANESPYDNGVNRYPDPHQRALKALIAELKGVDAGRIFLGNGSDEAIDLAFRIFCRPGLDNAVSIAPTYGMYRVAAATNDVQMREVPLGAGYSLPVGALLAAADERTKLMWLCSPNNPTGNAFPAQEIESLLRRFDGIVVLDEAYIDFADGGGFLPRLGEFPNLIVLQTLSKAWGMAGLRLGLAFASEEIAGLFGRVKYPYNINTLTQRAVAESLRRDISAAGGGDPRRTLAPGAGTRGMPLHRAGLPVGSQLPAGKDRGTRPVVPGAGRGGGHRPQPFADRRLRRLPAHHGRAPGGERPHVGNRQKFPPMKKALFIDRDGTVIAEPPAITRSTASKSWNSYPVRSRRSGRSGGWISTW